MRPLIRFGLPSIGLLAAGALALPAVRAAGPGGCEPGDWMDWHLAMRQQCLEPQYVCRHMTSAEMLRDPQIAAAYREGLAAEASGRAYTVTTVLVLFVQPETVTA